MPSNRPHVLITGKPGTGKTTALRKAIAGRKEAGGFLTEEIRERGRRVGFAIRTLDGRQGLLASKSLESGARVGSYRVNTADIERLAVGSIREALEDPGKEVIVIDEIASMELACRGFEDAVRDALESSKRVIATVQDKDLPFLNEIRARSDVMLIALTEHNRDSVPYEVAKLLGWQETGGA